MQAPRHKKELDRLIKLSEMDLDYSDLSKYLDDLTHLAARISGARISIINLIDSYTQWTVSDIGIELDQMPREDSICQFTILEEEELEVEDLAADDRFKDREYVKGDPGIRYYLGIPLQDQEGLPLGALCIMDQEKQDIDPEKVELLKMIAKEVVKRLESLQKMNELQQKVHDLEKTQKKLSHDIRGPISGIIGVAEIIESQGANNRIEDILELITLVKKGGESVLELATEIMEQDTKNDKEPGRNEYSAGSFSKKLLELYMPQARTKDISLDISTAEGSKPIHFPKAKLLQIAGNLISNSIKFTPEGGEVKVSIEISNSDEEQNKAELILRVSDSGVGISVEKIADILNGGTDTTQGTTGEKGYGFGLSLVKHLIDSAGGKMEINSKAGKGTTFLINIPV